jgi:hypothetical protein
MNTYLRQTAEYTHSSLLKYSKYQINGVGRAVDAAVAGAGATDQC